MNESKIMICDFSLLTMVKIFKTTNHSQLSWIIGINFNILIA